jgi:Flp pilus assembly pilin Flp
MDTALQLALVLWSTGIDRARALRADDDRERGASALEWAIISAILVTAAVLIGGVIYRVVSSKGTQLEQCAKQPPGAAGCP